MVNESTVMVYHAELLTSNGRHGVRYAFNNQGEIMKQYPIWNKVEACIYKGQKSYGVRETGEVEVLVGTSSRNSHSFLTHCVTHRKIDDKGTREFRFYVDGNCIKKAKVTGGDYKEI